MNAMFLPLRTQRTLREANIEGCITSLGINYDPASRVSQGMNHTLHLTSPDGRRVSSKSAGRALQGGIEINFNPES